MGGVSESEPVKITDRLEPLRVINEKLSVVNAMFRFEFGEDHFRDRVHSLWIEANMEDVVCFGIDEGDGIGKRSVLKPAALAEFRLGAAELVEAVTSGRDPDEVDPNEDFASYSNYGDYLEITVPGSSVLLTYPADVSNGGAYFSGTSMATPVVPAPPVSRSRRGAVSPTKNSGHT